MRTAKRSNNNGRIKYICTGCEFTQTVVTTQELKSIMPCPHCGAQMVATEV